VRPQPRSLPFSHVALEVADSGRNRLAPSMHWPAPIVTRDVDQDEGPVLVTIEYRIKPTNRDAFPDRA